jgi:hypothetical protein
MFYQGNGCAKKEIKQFGGSKAEVVAESEKPAARFANAVGKIALALDPACGGLVFYAKQQYDDKNGHCINCKNFGQLKSNISTSEDPSQPADPAGNLFRKQFARSILKALAFGQPFDEGIEERYEHIKQRVFDVAEKKEGNAENRLNEFEHGIMPRECTGDDDGVVEMINVIEALIHADPAVNAQDRRDRAADESIEEHQTKEGDGCRPYRPALDANHAYLSWIGHKRIP